MGKICQYFWTFSVHLSISKTAKCVRTAIASTIVLLESYSTYSSRLDIYGSPLVRRAIESVESRNTDGSTYGIPVKNSIESDESNDQSDKSVNGQHQNRSADHREIDKNDRRLNNER